MAEGRVFTCGMCGRTVWICKRCDRGHRYCSKACSEDARRASSTKARRKFQRTSRGRKSNARRQLNYYYRHLHTPHGILTHHTSKDPPECCTIAAPRLAVIGENQGQIACERERTQAQSGALPAGGSQFSSSLPEDAPRCAFCGRLVRVA